MKRTIAEMSGLSPDAILVGIDGCSVSVFGLPLSGVARAFARLGAASGRDPREAALARIRDAMRAFPRATGGAGRLSTELMERTRGRLVAKGGAEGLECLALPERRLGLALKCEDGASRGLGPALVGILEALGLLDPDAIAALGELRRPEIRNHAGLVVGALEAEVATPAAARA
jgi:L-asparaginase II